MVLTAAAGGIQTETFDLAYSLQVWFYQRLQDALRVVYYFKANCHEFEVLYLQL